MSIDLFAVKRVLFLISDTGGGHRASANALAEALHRIRGDAVQCQVVDVFADYAAWPLSAIPRTYLPLVNRYGWLWQLLWRIGDRPAIWRAVTATVEAWQGDRMERCYIHHPADLIVSVHPLLNQVPQRVLRRFWPRARFATIVTDLSTAHRIWYSPQVDLLSAPCNEVREAALAAGVPAERIRLMGLPISLKFLQRPPARAALRLRLRLIEDRPTVLLAGGGEGMGPVGETAEALAAALADQCAQLVVVCGRNERLRRRLAGQQWPLPVQVHGFVDNMPEWMAAADCLVTKAGPGTIAEALASGLPMVLSGFIPGQEEGNVEYVVQHGVGSYSPNPNEIAKTVSGWLQPGNLELAAMQERAYRLARPQAALEIAEALGELLA